MIHRCARCQGKIDYDPAQSGQQVSCPHCQAPIQLPNPKLLIQCPACGETAARKAAACPHCGFVLHRPLSIGTILAAVFIVISALVIGGCIMTTGLPVHVVR